MRGVNMDIAALSVVMSQSSVQTAAVIAVAKMAMNTNEENGTQLAKMMENIAVDPNLGNHIDVSV